MSIPPGMSQQVSFEAVIPAPGFCLGLRTAAGAITGIEFLEPRSAVAPKTALARRAAAQLEAWLADPVYAFDLPLAPAGSAFQRRVWAGIVTIPAGETLSYGELARRLASGARAVGAACGANPYPLVVPCHRVVAADGGLGGFARQRGGFLLDVKRWLLAHERS